MASPAVCDPCPTPVSAAAVANGKPQLKYSPGRLAPSNIAFQSSRKPLAVQLTVNGQPLFVIVNHFNSKASPPASVRVCKRCVLVCEGTWTRLVSSNVRGVALTPRLEPNACIPDPYLPCDNRRAATSPCSAATSRRPALPRCSARSRLRWLRALCPRSWRWTLRLAWWSWVSKHPGSKAGGGWRQVRHACTVYPDDGLSRPTWRAHAPCPGVTRVKSVPVSPPPALLLPPGDLNDFAGSSALGVLYASGLTNAYLLPEQSGLLRTPPNQRYSYNFEGNAQVRLVWPPILRLCYQLAPPCNHPPLPPHAPSLVLQALDHILLSPSLVGGAEVGVLHVNSEFADDAPASTRFSDHDPLLVRLPGAREVLRYTLSCAVPMICSCLLFRGKI